MNALSLSLRSVKLSLVALSLCALGGCTVTEDDGSADPAEVVAGDDAVKGGPSAAQLLALTQSCVQASSGKFKTDEDSGSASIPICKLNGAFFWKADMDIDCDGKKTSFCNTSTDDAFQDETSLTDNHNKPLDASAIPWIVVPVQQSKFNYTKAGISLGATGLVIYKGKLAYGIFADECGVDGIIGEASVAMARKLGVNADPSNGGVDPKDVTYIVFTGKDAVTADPTNTAEAVALGTKLATKLVANNK